MSSLIGEAFVRVRPVTTGFAQEAQGGVSEAGTKLGKVFGAAFAAVGVAQLGKSFVSAAIEHQAAFAVLEQATKNAGASNVLYGQTLEHLLEKEARLKGFSDEQLASSFQRLVSVTHDSGKAFSDLGKAEDIARFSHKGLELAALGLAKAEQGNFAALARFSFVVPKVTTAVDALKAKYTQLQESGAKLDPVQKAQYENALKIAEAQDKQATAAAGLALVNSRVGGSAAVFSQQAIGKIQSAQQVFHQFGVQIGDKVIPAVIFLGDHLHTVALAAESLGAVFVGTKAVSFFDSLGVTAAAATGRAATSTVAVESLTAAIAANTEALTGSMLTVSSTATATLAGVSTASSAEVGIAGAAASAEVGTAAAAATGKLGLLSSKLLGLGALAIAPIVIPYVLKNVGDVKNIAHKGAGAAHWYDFLLEGPTLAAEAYHLITGSGNDPKKTKPLFPARDHIVDTYNGVAAEAAAAATKAAAGKKGELAKAGQSMIASLAAGIKTDQSDLADLKTQMADAVSQGVQAVNAAVDQAKQNLNTIGGSLASAITAIISKPVTDAQAKLTAAQNQLGLHAAETTLKTLGQEILLPGGKRLSADPKKALAELEALQRTKHGSPGLEAFIQQYQQAALGVDSAHLAIRQQLVDRRSQGATRRISDLTDEFNTGAITAGQLNRAITRELVRDGASYKRAGHLLGKQFADGLVADIHAVGAQASALVGGPQRPGSGLAPSIVRPIETLNQLTRQEASIAKQQRAKQIDLAAKTHAVLTKIENNAKAAGFTSSLDRNPGEKSKVSARLAGLGGG